MHKFLRHKVVWFPFTLALSGVIMLGATGTMFADDEVVDLTDNELCLDCHIDEEFLGLLEIECITPKMGRSSTKIT